MWKCIALFKISISNRQYRLKVESTRCSKRHSSAFQSETSMFINFLLKNKDYKIQNFSSSSSNTFLWPSHHHTLISTHCFTKIPHTANVYHLLPTKFHQIRLQTLRNHPLLQNPNDDLMATMEKLTLQCAKFEEKLEVMLKKLKMVAILLKCRGCYIGGA